MAYTKTNPITTTLRKAIDYILNPDKTDDELYVSSFACSPDTADIEFNYTRKQSNTRGIYLARHLIQSFAPSETTPEQAHEIGLKLAEEVLGGKYEFVISTHLDKGNIHNHIIFNSVSFVDYKKYHSNKYTYRNIQRTSDRICKEYGLSVIVPNTDNRSKNTKYENKPTSWRAKLKTEIDKIIPKSKDFEDFLHLMELQGYEIKQGQYISVRAKGQERFIRLKSETLGERYSVEGITKRIAAKTRKRKPIIRDNRISLIIDIQNCIKAQESKGYEHWAKINNLKQASKTLNYLTEHNISSYAELESRIDEMRRSFDDTADKLKSTEHRLNNTNILRKNISTYKELRPIYEEYTNAKDKVRFEKQHQREIILFKAAHKYLSETQTDGKLPALETVNAERMELEEQKQKLYADYKKAKKELSEIDVVKANVDTMLNVPQKPEQTRENQIE